MNGSGFGYQVRSVVRDFVGTVNVHTQTPVRSAVIFVLGASAATAAVRGVWGFLAGRSTVAETRGERSIEWAAGGAREGVFVGLVLLAAAKLLSTV